MLLRYFAGILLVLSLMVASYNRNEVWGTSYSLWSSAALRSPNKARPHVNLGVILFKEKRFDEAQRELLRAIEIKPHYPTALQYLGFISVRKGDINKAIEYYKVALSRYPEIAEIWYYLGHELESLGRYAEAEEAYKKSQSLKVDFMLPIIRLGHMLDELGRGDEMRELLLSITRRNPELLDQQPYLRQVLEGGGTDNQGGQESRRSDTQDE